MPCGKPIDLTAGVTLQVRAPLATVWGVLQDFEFSPEYNPTYLQVERVNGGTTTTTRRRLQPNDQFRAVRSDGKVELKVVSSVEQQEHECSISFVETCTSTYSFMVKAIDDDSCWLIATFAAAPNSALLRVAMCLCGGWFRSMATRVFASQEVEPVAREAERRVNVEKRNRSSNTTSDEGT